MLRIDGLNAPDGKSSGIQQARTVKSEKLNSLFGAKKTSGAGDKDQQYIPGCAGWKFETTGKKGERIVTQYDDTGSTYNVKNYGGANGGLYASDTYDAKTNKLLKQGFYDFFTGKLYMEREYKDDKCIEKEYNNEGSYIGKKVISSENGSSKVEVYDSDGTLIGYKVSTKISGDSRISRYEVLEYDAAGNFIGKSEMPYDIGWQMIRG